MLCCWCCLLEIKHGYQRKSPGRFLNWLYAFVFFSSIMRSASDAFTLGAVICIDGWVQVEHSTLYLIKTHRIYSWVDLGPHQSRGAQEENLPRVSPWPADAPRQQGRVWKCACCDIRESTGVRWWWVELWISVKRVWFTTAKASDMGGHTADSRQRSSLQTHTHTEGDSARELPPCFLKQSQADSQPDTMVAPHWGRLYRFTSGSKNITSAAPIPTDPLDKWNPTAGTSRCTAESLQGRASQGCVSKHQPVWDHLWGDGGTSEDTNCCRCPLLNKLNKS